MSSTKKYEVIRDNCLSCEIGDVIELTESKAASLINKVKPVESKAIEVKQVEEKKTPKHRTYK